MLIEQVMALLQGLFPGQRVTVFVRIGTGTPPDRPAPDLTQGVRALRNGHPHADAAGVEMTPRHVDRRRLRPARHAEARHAWIGRTLCSSAQGWSWPSSARTAAAGPSGPCTMVLYRMP